MRLHPRLHSFPRAGRAGSRGGFTLSELMISGTCILAVLMGILYAQLTGARMFQITKAKLGASDDAREAINDLVGEIRAAKLIRVGTGSATGFTEVGVDSAQRGNAVQIHATTNLNVYSRYFLDASSQSLKRITNGATVARTIASSITNTIPFTAEDFRGTVQTNNENNRVIGLTLQFYQIQYPVVRVGPGEYFDFYQIRTKIARRALE